MVQLVSYRMFNYSFYLVEILIKSSVFFYIQVYFWVFNDCNTFSKGYELGATGIMTDCPSLLRAYLQENPHIVSARMQGADIDYIN